MPTFSGGSDGGTRQDREPESRSDDGQPPKERVALLLEPEVLRKFKEAGDDWQDLINEALRKALKDRN